MGNSLKQVYEVISPDYYTNPLDRQEKKNQQLKQEELRWALINMLNMSESTEDARLLMEALGYLPHKTFARMNNRVTETSDKSKTNGYLESIGRL